MAWGQACIHRHRLAIRVLAGTSGGGKLGVDGVHYVAGAVCMENFTLWFT